MGDEQLRSVAEGMGLKKVDPSKKEELIYRILDQQAVDRASAGAERRRATEKNTEKPEPKKRTRKKKEEVAQSDDKSIEQQAEKTEATPVSEETPKKRRGRPSKKEIEERRKQEETTTVQADPESDSTKAAPAEPTETPETATDEKIVSEQPKADNTENEPKKQRDFRPSANADTSLGSFFPRSEGRKFVPRSQKERLDTEKNTQPAPQSPITIAEPGQQMPGQQQGKKNKNRKDRQQHDHRFDFSGLLEAAGVLDIEPQGHGFLRSSDFNYMPSPDDIYVSQAQIKQFGLKTGDVVEASVRPPRENDKYFILTDVLRVNGRSLDFIRDRVPFEHLTPLFPDEKFDITSGSTCNISTRVVDMFAPIGKGQRGLIVAPPKTGKTLLLKDVANAIAENHPETYIIILLIDERPEEVTDMQRSVNAEVIASTFDEPADRHVRIAGIVLEKAQRMVECG
ncbi:MAG: transcription termination factor Rho, partial [Muribaculaceae bacterium]|nr:transcription termination factor Rho [Muribaculaceae bacterium]